MAAMNELYDFDHLRVRAAMVVERIHNLGYEDAVVVILEALLEVRRHAQGEAIAMVNAERAKVVHITERIERLERTLLEGGYAPQLED
jgi:hypothetical protein